MTDEAAISNSKLKKALRGEQEKNLTLQARVDTLELLYREAVEAKEKYEKKWRDTLAVMEDAREMVGGLDEVNK